MKITIFGATGAIGKIVAEYSLRNGDLVTAYVRNPDSISNIQKNLSIVVGDLSNQGLIEKAIKESDIVISTLGPAVDISRKFKGTPIGDGFELIINAMEKFNKKRFIALETPSVHSEEDKKNFSTVIPPIAAKIFLPNAYRDMKKIEMLIKRSPLDWTVVRMIKPINTQKSTGYQISLGDKPAKFIVSRENVASFIYKTASENSFVHKMPIVYNN